MNICSRPKSAKGQIDVAGMTGMAIQRRVRMVMLSDFLLLVTLKSASSI